MRVAASRRFARPLHQAQSGAAQRKKSAKTEPFVLYIQHTSMKTNPFGKAALHPRQRCLETARDTWLGGKPIQFSKNDGSVHQPASSYPRIIRDFSQGRIKLWKTLDCGSLTAA